MSSPETQPHGPERPTLAPAQDPATASTVGADDAATPATPAAEPPLPGPTSPTLSITGDAAPSRPLPVIPGYTLLRRIGGGGMGEVYQAINRLGRHFALKLIRPDRTGDEFRARFRKEAAALIDLDHPNVARIFDYSEVEGAPYFTMRLLTGGTLAARAAGLRADPHRAAELMAVIADAVAYLHGRKLLHRDLKPSNVLFDDEGRPFISDFGLVKDLGPGEEDPPATAADTAPDLSLTSTGLVMGTVRYMAPEQVRGEIDRVGPWSDVWALGVILYELLTGTLPFDDDDVAALKHRIQTDEPRPLRDRNPEPDVELERIVLKCLAKRPEDRYPAAMSLAEDLRASLNRAQAAPEPKPQPQRSRLARLAFAGVSVAVVAVVAGVFLLPGPEPASPPPEPPPRQQHTIQQRLARGEAVAFLGEKGMPEYHRVVTGPETHPWLHRADGAFTIDTQRLGLVEICPAPPPMSFRFRVWVRQNFQISPASRAGVYVLHGEHEVAGGRLHSFIELSVQEDDTDLRDTEPGRKWKPGERVTSVAAFARLAGDTPEYSGNRPLGLASEETWMPKRGQQEMWRKLEVVVTEADVVAWHDKKVVGRVSRRGCEDRFGTLLVGAKRLAPAAAAARGGLGLYVLGGSASFRLGAVEPLKSAQ